MRSNPPDSPRRPGRAARLAVALTTLAVGLLGGGLLAGPAAAQDGTTTTLPVDNRELGHIIPRPDSGKAPESPSDPGGWLQVSLFFLICAVVVAMVAFVWWRSRVARRRRAEAGRDPVALARAAGKGVRPTRPA